MTQTELFAILLIGLFIIFLLGCIVISIISIIIDKYRKSHSKCSLEEYAERHSCCYYCTRYIPKHCQITKKEIYFPRKKRNCPIFNNVFEGEKIRYDK